VKYSVNQFEKAVFDFVLANFSGTSTAAPGDSAPNVHKCRDEKSGKEFELEVGRIYSVRLGDCYRLLDAEENTYSFDQDQLGELVELTCPLVALNLDGLSDEDEDEDIEEELNDIAEGLILASTEMLVDALRLVHADANSYDEFLYPTKCQHTLHIFAVSTTSAEFDFELNFGLVASRNVETDETRFTLILNDPIPLRKEETGFVLIDPSVTIDEKLCRDVVSLIGTNLPSDVLDNCKLDNLLVGFTDVDAETETNLVEKLSSVVQERNGDEEVAVEYSLYTKAGGVFYARTSTHAYDVDDEEDGEEDLNDIAEIAVLTVILPISNSISFASLDAISEENTNRMLTATFKALDMPTEESAAKQLLN